MDFKFSKDSGNSQQVEVHSEKKNQSALLVLLLILVGGFTYIYFFTGLIKPLEAQKAVETAVSSPPSVKMPLPTREGESAKPDGKPPEKAEVPKTVTHTTVAVVVPAAKPAAAPPKSADKAVPATVPTPAKPKDEPKKAEVVKPADKKPQPAPATDKNVDKAAVATADVKKPVAAAKTNVVADRKSTTTKDRIKKPVSTSQAKPKPAVITKKTASDSWSLVVGNYVLEEALSTDMGRVRKAGFEPIVKPSSRKKTAMNRLFVSEFNNRATAQLTLEKLKRLTSDAFVIEKGGRFSVYAGSYLQGESARSEKERLQAAGISITVKHSDIEIPSQSLSVGPFDNKKAAEAALDRLKRAGIKAILSKK